MMFTMGHELTHFIKKWSPEKFKIFGDFLIEQYGKHNISVDAMIKNKMAQLNTTDVDYAYEELVADACESMLVDSNAVEKLVMLNQKDKGIVAKIKEFINTALAKVKALYKKLIPDSAEAKAVKEMSDILSDLSKLFEDALVDAAHNKTKADANTNEAEISSDLIVISENRKYSKRTDEEILSVKQQISLCLDKLSQMSSVINIDISNITKDNVKDFAQNEIKNIPEQIDVKDFGIVITDRKRLDNGLRYISSADEYVAYKALQRVLKRGVLIHSKVNHKNRGYSTFTIAAPISFVEGNITTNHFMAVVIRSEGKNYYKMHRVVMTNGEISNIIKKETMLKGRQLLQTR